MERQWRRGGCAAQWREAARGGVRGRTPPRGRDREGAYLFFSMKARASSTW